MTVVQCRPAAVLPWCVCAQLSWTWSLHGHKGHQETAWTASPRNGSSRKRWHVEPAARHSCHCVMLVASQHVLKQTVFNTSQLPFNTKQTPRSLTAVATLNVHDTAASKCTVMESKHHCLTIMHWLTLHHDNAWPRMQTDCLIQMHPQ